ncbi:unnamed protein product [Polarella glacialis]|uniref:Uncharacterized protein n=1 Tax=Polarella glacialis TaxID=89957 RepID=A0A813F884_POLGL|nr:unnamed protein product [Polarella glacialis]
MSLSKYDEAMGAAHDEYSVEALRRYDRYYTKDFSDDEHYRCELAGTSMDSVKPFPDLLDNEAHLGGLHLVMHAVAPLQSFDSLDEERVAYFENLLTSGVPCTAWAIGDLNADDYGSFEGNPFIKTGLTSFLLDGHHKMAAAARSNVPVGLLVFIPRSTRAFVSWEACAQNSSSATDLSWTLQEQILLSRMPDLLPSFASFSLKAPAYSPGPPDDIILNTSTSEDSTCFSRMPSSTTVRDILKLLVSEHNCINCRGLEEYLVGSLWLEWPPSAQFLNKRLVDVGVRDGWKFDHVLQHPGSIWTDHQAPRQRLVWKVDAFVERESELLRQIYDRRMQKKTKSNLCKLAGLRGKLLELQQSVPILMHKFLHAQQQLVKAWEDQQDQDTQDQDGHTAAWRRKSGRLGIVWNLQCYLCAVYVQPFSMHHWVRHWT